MTDTNDDGFDLGMPYQPDPEEEAFYARREQFVKEWREAHSDWLWGDDWWQCPLCSGIEQADHSGQPLVWFIKSHQTAHGKDWLSYEALAAAPEAGATGGDR